MLDYFFLLLAFMLLFWVLEHKGQAGTGSHPHAGQGPPATPAEPTRYVYGLPIPPADRARAEWEEREARRELT